MKPVQLDGLPITAGTKPSDGPSAPPDRRNWRRVHSLLVGVNGGLETGQTRHLRNGYVEEVPRDKLALRWHGGWRLVERWRPEREGILCVLENGSSVWVLSPGAVMATSEPAP